MTGEPEGKKRQTLSVVLMYHAYVPKETSGSVWVIEGEYDADGNDPYPPEHPKTMKSFGPTTFEAAGEIKDSLASDLRAQGYEVFEVVLADD